MTPTTSNANVRRLAALAVLGAACWIPSELIELAYGAYTPSVFWLTAGFHLLVGLGIWGLYLATPAPRGRLGLAGAAIASVGYLLLTWPPIAVVTGPGVPMTVFLETNPLFATAGVAAVSGTVLFAVAALRRGHYPTWAAVVLIVGPPIMAFALARGPARLANAVNLLQSCAWIAMGRVALRD